MKLKYLIIKQKRKHICSRGVELGNNSPLKLKKGDSPEFTRDDNLVSCAWHDPKQLRVMFNNNVDKRERSKNMKEVLGQLTSLSTTYLKTNYAPKKKYIFKPKN